VAEPILADDHRRATREDLQQAILQRTTRGLLTHNTGRVHRLKGDDLWAVPSTRGGFYQVDLETEVCSCEDFTFYGQDHGVPCRHVYAAAIARASCRDGIQVRSVGVAGDPFVHAGDRRECSACFAGYTIITVEDDGEERDEPVRCRRCASDGAV
jgi:SWIM zinc finger